MQAGLHDAALRRVLATLCLSLVWSFAPAPAGAAEPAPPSAAAFQRATREVLADPAFQAAPRNLLERGSGGTSTNPVPPPGTGAIFPSERMLALYGAPQLASTALGARSPAGATRLLRRQVSPYEELGDRPVIPSFDLIAVVANSTPGTDRLYRTRQPDRLIAQYLDQVRETGGRLVLDIQPGRSPALDEVKALAPWIAQPDVDVAIDPEWNVGPGGVPGETAGSITARDLNAVSRRIARIAHENGLPPKLLIVHQFRERSIRQRSRIRQRRGVEITLNFDGIGASAPKITGYESLTTEGLFNGFSLFYDLDTPLMKPGRVLALEPAVDFLLYQ